MLASMYLEDLNYAGLSTTEFEILKREVGMRCKFFPSVAEILECRDIFVDGIFEPTAADRQAALEDSNYRFGRTQVHWNDDMINQVLLDYEDKPSDSKIGYANILKSIK